LEITAEDIFRTGYVPRDDEIIYKQNSQEGIFTTNIKLEEPVNFTANYDLYVPPSALAYKKKNDITIDGILSKSEWEDIPYITNFLTSDGEVAEHQTKIKFMYDNNYFYIAAFMEEPSPENMISTAVPPIPLTWNDDDIEFFFDTKNSQKDYIRLFQNFSGIRFNSLERWVENKYFESKYISEIFIGENFWSIEMQIPWSDIKINESPNSGDIWSINVGRHRQQSKIKVSRWSGRLYDPQKYGILRFE
jgi:hypothetical protein